MRVSSEPKDPDYFLCLFEKKVVVHLDGAPVELAIEADDEARYVIHNVRDGDGKIARNHDGADFLKARSEGRVELVGKRRPVRLSNAN